MYPGYSQKRLKFAKDPGYYGPQYTVPTKRKRYPKFHQTELIPDDENLNNDSNDNGGSGDNGGSDFRL